MLTCGPGGRLYRPSKGGQIGVDILCGPRRQVIEYGSCRMLRYENTVTRGLRQGVKDGKGGGPVEKRASSNY